MGGRAPFSRPPARKIAVATPRARHTRPIRHDCARRRAPWGPWRRVARIRRAAACAGRPSLGQNVDVVHPQVGDRWRVKCPNRRHAHGPRGPYVTPARGAAPRGPRGGASRAHAAAEPLGRAVTRPKSWISWSCGAPTLEHEAHARASRRRAPDRGTPPVPSSGRPCARRAVRGPSTAPRPPPPPRPPTAAAPPGLSFPDVSAIFYRIDPVLVSEGGPTVALKAPPGPRARANTQALPDLPAAPPRRAAAAPGQPLSTASWPICRPSRDKTCTRTTGQHAVDAWTAQVRAAAIIRAGSAAPRALGRSRFLKLLILDVTKGEQAAGPMCRCARSVTEVP